jgi:thiol-disulfide isomerase/thioredoxin
MPDWYSIPITNVNTGRTFSLQDFRGKVILIETMAEWCPGCMIQQTYSLAMRMQLNNPPDLVLVSLDVEMSEDAASLKAYADQNQFDWYVAVAPLLVARALGTQYNVEYLNPPLNPMLLIDRQGAAHQLPFGVKAINQLQSIVAYYLAQ